MSKTEKKINKILIWAIIWSALISAGSLSMTPKGKSFWKRLLRKSKSWTWFLKRGFVDFKKEFFGGTAKKRKKTSPRRKRVKNDDM